MDSAADDSSLPPTELSDFDPPLLVTAVTAWLVTRALADLPLPRWENPEVILLLSVEDLDLGSVR